MNGSRERRPEEVIRMAVECLNRTGYPLLGTVSCRMKRGVLVLRGRLPSYYHKQLAQEAVMRLDGVRQLINRIEVTSSPRHHGTS